eukprot:Rmarinus@m.7840
MGSKSVSKQLTEIFGAAIKAAYPSVEVNTLLAASKNVKHAHYQCNNAMGLLKKLKGTENAPKTGRDIAENILKHLPESASDLVEKTEVSGPGFINITLKAGWLADRLKSATVVANGVRVPIPSGSDKKKVIVDFSSPNIAKSMHVGHLRSTIIGDALCRIFEFQGHEVDRVNHVGDWGTQFGMLICHLEETFPDWNENRPHLGDVNEFYKNARAKFDGDEAFKERSRDAVVKLQAGDERARKAWNLFRDESREEFDEIYKRLDVTIEERGESFYNDMLPDVIQKLENTEINGKSIVEISNGAKCIFVPGHEVPVMIVKGDGAYNYDSTDMAGVWHRIKECKGDWLVYVTDAGQGDHFKRVFAAAKLAGWTEGVRIDHVPFGLVCGADGKKFKTRSGETVSLASLLDEACTRALDALRSKQEERKQQDSTAVVLTEEEMKSASNVIGIGAVKYADLKTHRIMNYIFSYDKMLDLNGNTAVYLLYALARCYSIIRKSGKDVEASFETTKIELTQPEEITLAWYLTRFQEYLDMVEADLCPHFLCEYAYQASEYLNSMYTKCQVIGSENEDSRLALVYVMTVHVAHALRLLGLKPLQQL